MKFSIVIPSYMDAAGLWYTIAAAKADIENDFSEDDYEIIAVVDGPEDDETCVILNLRQQKCCKLIGADTRTPQKNRHKGLEVAQAPYVFFLDSHVIPSRGFFKRMYDSMSETGAAILHSPHCFWKRKALSYGYQMDWSHQFWATRTEIEPQRTDAPYRICVSGHGAICVDREKYLSVGGYWDELRGWGGEEPELNLKMWHLGHEVYIEPRVYHWHFMPSKRRMKNLQATPEYARNFMLVAYVDGGKKYLDQVHESFTMINNGHATLEEAIRAKPKMPYLDIYEKVPEVAARERELICSGKFGGHLDEMIKFFMLERIPH